MIGIWFNALLELKDTDAKSSHIVTTLESFLGTCVLPQLEPAFLPKSPLIALA